MLQRTSVRFESVCTGNGYRFIEFVSYLLVREGVVFRGCCCLPVYSFKPLNFKLKPFQLGSWGPGVSVSNAQKAHAEHMYRLPFPPDMGSGHKLHSHLNLRSGRFKQAWSYKQ